MKKLKKEKVSIIVPIYNVEKYLKKCFDSLINQSYKNIEILAINDGSPDNSQAIINDYAKTDSRIKVIIKENGGYGSVLETAIQMIESEYFLICDPDDYLEPNAIEVLYNVANKSNADLIYGKFYHVYPKEKIEISFESFFKLESLKVYKKELGKFVFIPVSPHAKLYKTSIVKDLKFPYNVSFTDALLYYYALSKSKSFVFVDEFLANYFIEREGNTSTDENPKIFQDHLIVTQNIINNVDLYDNKYLLLGLFFYNWHILITLSRQKEEIIKAEKEKIYKMYANLFPYKESFQNILEINQSLKELINVLFDENKYKKTIDSMLENFEQTKSDFLKELTKLNKNN